jgi:tetratricopeptide (TPR) repeat protein
MWWACFLLLAATLVCATEHRRGDELYLLATAAADASDYESALQYLKDARSAFVRTDGEASDAVVDVSGKLGAALHNMNQLEEARAVLQEAIRLQAIVTRDISTARTAHLHSLLADLYVSLKDTDTAIEHHEAAMLIIDQHLHDTGDNAAITYTRYANTLTLVGDHQGAFVLLNRALDIYKAAGMLDHEDAATVYILLGMASFGSGQLEKARNFTDRGLSIYRRVFSDGSMMLINPLWQSARLYAAAGSTANAIHDYATVLEIAENTLGHLHHTCVLLKDEFYQFMVSEGVFFSHMQ